MALLIAALAFSGLSACGKGNVFSLKVGTCFNGSLEGELKDVETVTCSEPHGSEVYAVFDAPGSSWPGENSLVRLADRGCLSSFKAFVGEEYEYSEWYIAYLYPTKDSWEQIDDREITCVVEPEYGQVSWSAAGTGR